MEASRESPNRKEQQANREKSLSIAVCVQLKKQLEQLVAATLEEDKQFAEKANRGD